MDILILIAVSIAGGFVGIAIAKVFGILTDMIMNRAVLKALRAESTR